MIVTTMDVMAAGRSAREVLAWSRGLVEPALRSAVGTLPTSTLRVAGYHLGWWDEHGRPVRVSGGKAIRAALVLCSGQAVGGTAAAAVPAAVGVPAASVGGPTAAAVPAAVDVPATPGVPATWESSLIATPQRASQYGMR